MSRRPIVPAILAAVVLLALALPARAAITVTITSVTPTDGKIGDKVGVTQATIAWEIKPDASETGTYRVEVGGDGTPDSGRLVADSTGSGDFTGDLTATTTVTETDDLKDGDGDYTVYVIAINGADSTTSNASTTLHLDNYPKAPKGLGAGTGDEKLFLSWEKGSARDIKKFLLYYGTSPGTTAGDYTGADASQGPSPIDVGTAVKITLKGLTNGTTYYFRVAMVDDAGDQSPLSDEANGAPQAVEGLAGLTGEKGGCAVADAANGDWTPLLAVVAGAAALALFRRRRSRLLTVLLPAIAVGALAVPAAHADQRPIRFSTDFHFSFLVPQIKEFKTVYQGTFIPTFGFGFGYKLVADLELVAEATYGFKDGKGVTAAGAHTAEKYKLHVAPMALSLLYRLKFYEDQPVVPYLGGGATYLYFHEQRVAEPGVNTDGGKWGWQAFGGLQFLLDLIDRRAAASMAVDYGIDNTYFFYEFRYQAIDDFRTKAKGLDFTSMLHTLGLRIEY